MTTIVMVNSKPRRIPMFASSVVPDLRVSDQAVLAKCEQRYREMYGIAPAQPQQKCSGCGKLIKTVTMYHRRSRGRCGECQKEFNQEASKKRKAEHPEKVERHRFYYKFDYERGGAE